MESKIIVQHRGTRAYISGDAQQRWTHHSLMARLFETPYHALHFCVDKDVQNANVILRSADGREVCFLRC